MMISSKRRIGFVFLGMLLVLIVAPLQTKGQQITATLVGHVADIQGSAVPGAQIAATNNSTGIRRTTTSNGQGDYRIEYLPIGGYSVTVTAPGFKKFIQKNVVLTVDQTQTVQAKLEVGGASQTVTVNSAPPLVNTSTAEIGRTVEQKEITTLPIVGRNAYSLLTLTPGVQSSSTNNTYYYPSQVTIVNGGFNQGVGSVSYYLDGGLNMTYTLNTGNVIPNPDALEEFRVETSNYSAAYGRASAAVVTVVTRSGTNNLHGSLFEFYRTKGLNATPWNSSVNPPLHRNQFGGTVGGPIVKNRTFFFGSYSGLRQVSSTFYNTAIVGTSLERSGNFSQSSIKPVDPTTGLVFDYNGQPGWIPPNRLDPTAQNFFNPPAGLLGIPSANEPGDRWAGNIVMPTDTNEYLAKIDHELSQSHRLTGSFYRNNGSLLAPLVSGGNMSPDLPWSIQNLVWTQYNVNLSDTWTISPNRVNQAWFTFMQNYGAANPVPKNSLTDYGSDYVLQGAPSLPDFIVSGYFRLGESINGPKIGSNLYSFRDVYNWTKGNHTIVFGGEGSLNKDVQSITYNNYGRFQFTGAKSHNPLADFVLGLPTNMLESSPVDFLANSWNWGLFAQDDWRVTPRMTLNLGLRYDLQTPPTDPQNRETTFVQGVQSRIVPTAPLGQLFVGDPGVGRAVIPARKTHYSPRVGLAWDPMGDGKTSVRAGAGLFYGVMSMNEWNSQESSAPFLLRNTFNNIASLTHPYANFPGGISPFPYFYNPANPTYVYPAALVGVEQNFQWPYTIQTNVSVQRQVTNHLAVTAAYVGSFSYKVTASFDFNYPIISNTANTTNVNQRRPIDPGILSSITNLTSYPHGAYNGLQLTAEQQTFHNLSFRAFYTFSKAMDSEELDDVVSAVTAQDELALGEERGRTDNDSRHEFVASAIWNLDYSRSSNGLVRNILNGWEISPIVTLQSGIPFSIETGADNNFDGYATDRANFVPGQKPTLDPHRSRDVAAGEWFNTAAFSPNGIGKGIGPLEADGNTPRNFVNAPGYKDVDLGVFRNITFNRLYLQARLEATNVFNMVNLGLPVNTLTSPLFGKITTAETNNPSGQARQLQLGLRLVF